MEPRQHVTAGESRGSVATVSCGFWCSQPQQLVFNLVHGAGKSCA